MEEHSLPPQGDSLYFCHLPLDSTPKESGVCVCVHVGVYRCAHLCRTELMTHVLFYYILSPAEFGVHGLALEPGVFSCQLRLVLGLQPPSHPAFRVSTEDPNEHFPH